jgi:hypothetical protein
MSDHNCNDGIGWMSFAVTGATGTTIISANDTNGISVGFSSISGEGLSVSRMFKLTGLTPGRNTFTAKYKYTQKSVTFRNRDIVVIPL